MDETERPINCPKEKAAQKNYYSGKKESNTVKNNVISERGGKVVYLINTDEGKNMTRE